MTPFNKDKPGVYVSFRYNRYTLDILVVFLYGSSNIICTNKSENYKGKQFVIILVTVSLKTRVKLYVGLNIVDN